MSASGFPPCTEMIRCLLHVILMSKLHLRVSRSIGSMVGICDWNVQGWRATFLTNGINFPDSQQGKYHRVGVLRNVG